jgi:hypothetical protein
MTNTSPLHSEADLTRPFIKTIQPDMQNGTNCLKSKKDIFQTPFTHQAEPTTKPTGKL